MAKIVYSIDKSILKERELLIDPAIPDAVRQCVNCFLELCVIDDDPSNPQVQPFEGMELLRLAMESKDNGASKGRISQLLKELKLASAMVEEKLVFPGEKKRVTNGRIVSLKNLQVYFRDKKENQPFKKTGRVKEVVLKQAEDLVSSLDKGVFLDLNGSSHNRIDSLFCILDSAMKSSSRDDRKSIVVDYYFNKNDKIEITAVTTTGEDDDIANLSDQRAIRVINGYYLEKIRHEISVHGEEYQPDGYVSFDLHLLCERMGLTPNNANKEVARSMLKRLSSTEFRIDATKSKYYKKNYGIDKGRFRYLVEYKAVTELELVDEAHDLHQVKERYYQVRLHGDIVQNLMQEGRAFISHPKLSRERMGLAHRLNNWSKAVVGVRPSSDHDLMYTIDQFHERVHPASTLYNFTRDFLKLIERECLDEWKKGEEGDSFTSNLHGYFYEVSWDQKLYETLTKRSGGRLKKKNDNYIIIKVWRDPEDLYVGDNSEHNKALRRDVQTALQFDA